MVHETLGLLREKYRDIPRPQPDSAAAHAPRLAQVFAQEPHTLTDEELHTVVWLVSPDLHNDVDALRYYLPYLLKSYVTSHILGEELQCRLLQFRGSFSVDERELITRVVVPRWKSNVGSDNDAELSFLLFWCDDLSPFSEAMEEIARLGDGTPADVYTERLVDLRRDVLASADPLRTLWNHLYFELSDSLLEERRKERGNSILEFLQRVKWHL